MENVELKKRKQKKKDDKKKQNKKYLRKSAENSKGKSISNLKEIPANCKHLVEIDDILYVVPGNGACGPNCAAGFLFQ